MNMNIMIIGIDGGDERIFRSMPTPVINQILDEGVNLDLKEDLWSRGWVEILSGKHGKEIGAFYHKPVLNGTTALTKRFNGKDYYNNRFILPMWDMVCQRGKTVGFMNVPTTTPAPKVEGFFVSGAGGGLSRGGRFEVPPDAVSPFAIAKYLEKNGYIFDIRFIGSQIRNTDKLFYYLKEMIEKRTLTFIELCKSQQPDFGFVAYMGTQRVQNLAMFEIEALIANNTVPSNHIQNLIIELFQALDGAIERLITELDPENIVLVSDHGQVPYLKSINVDPFLQRIGLQRPSSAWKKGAKRIVGKATEMAAVFIPERIQKSSLPGVKTIKKAIASKNIDWKTSKAFGARYVPGVYINENKRFGGPVHGEDNALTLAQEIVERLNESTEAKQNKLHAALYRHHNAEARFADFLPDVWIDHPDTMFFEGRGDFIMENKAYGPITSLEDVNRDMYTGIKGSKPLACLSTSMAAYVKESDPTDLTRVYQVIKRMMEK